MGVVSFLYQNAHCAHFYCLKNTNLTDAVSRLYQSSQSNCGPNIPVLCVFRKKKRKLSSVVPYLHLCSTCQELFCNWHFKSRVLPRHKAGIYKHTYSPQLSATLVPGIMQPSNAGWNVRQWNLANSLIALLSDKMCQILQLVLQAFW